jgi:hypothetical protein
LKCFGDLLKLKEERKRRRRVAKERKARKSENNKLFKNEI